MNRFASSFIGKPVVLAREQALIGIVEDLVINPDNGLFVGILLKEGFGKKMTKVVASKDIMEANSKFIIIKGLSAVGEKDEIVRIKDILDKDISIIGNQVYTIRNQYLGKVYDYTIETLTSSLSKIYVKPTLFHSLSTDFIISSQQIIAIEKKRIIVEDGAINNKKPIKLTKTAPTQPSI
jgi:sporulation protein YlmC with PRC-barrel domain